MFVIKRHIYNFSIFFWILTFCNIVYADESRLHKVNDLAYGVSLFNFYQNNYFSSITDLLVADKYNSIQNQGKEPELLLGSLYLLYGLNEEAGHIFQALIKDQSSISITDQAWLYLAKLNYKTGNINKAREALENIKGQLPSHRFAEGINLLSNIYLHQGQHNKAIELIKEYPSSPTWDAYTKFNIGSSLIYQNKLDAAESFIKQVANIQPYNKEQVALRDKANLALGFVSLKSNKPDSAIQYFNKIHLDSMLTTKALLGSGWAWSNKNDFNKALIPWLELTKYSLLDPSVQESMLAIPYALEKIGNPALALKNYNNAINNFHVQSQQLDQMISDIQQGKFLQSLLPEMLAQETYLHNLPSNRDKILSSPYFHTLFSTHDFQSNLKNLYDLLYLQAVIQRWQNNLPELKLMLTEREKNYTSKLRTINKNKNNKQLNSLINSRDKLASKVNTIEIRNDSLALGNEAELEQIETLSNIRKSISKLSGKQDMSELNEKHKRLYGLLYWKLHTDYKPRLWNAKNSLKQLDLAIKQSQSASRSLDDSITNAPKGFKGYLSTLLSQQKKIQLLANKINLTLEKQKNIINSLALASATDHKNRLGSYQLRAKYSLARLYDLQAKSTGTANE